MSISMAIYAEERTRPFDVLGENIKRDTLERKALTKNIEGVEINVPACCIFTNFTVVLTVSMYESTNNIYNCFFATRLCQ
jgi:hypothetical protein